MGAEEKVASARRLATLMSNKLQCALCHAPRTRTGPTHRRPRRAQLGRSLTHTHTPRPIQPARVHAHTCCGAICRSRFSSRSATTSASLGSPTSAIFCAACSPATRIVHRAPRGLSRPRLARPLREAAEAAASGG
eukprot:1786060-Prymnesium_polylepis.2